MFRSILSAAAITIVAIMSYVLSHRLDDRNYILFSGFLYFITLAFIFLFPTFFVPHILKAKHNITLSLITLTLFGYVSYRISLHDDPIEAQEGVRIAIISFASIPFNCLLALLLRSDKIMSASED